MSKTGIALSCIYVINRLDGVCLASFLFFIKEEKPTLSKRKLYETEYKFSSKENQCK